MQRLAAKPFALLGVNISGVAANKLAPVMVAENLTWRSFVDRGEIRRQWCNPGTPTLYVIDHTGVIRHKWAGKVGEAAIDRAVDTLVRAAEAAGSRR